MGGTVAYQVLSPRPGEYHRLYPGNGHYRARGAPNRVPRADRPAQDYVDRSEAAGAEHPRHLRADWWLWSDGSPPGGIACNEVIRLLPAYHAQNLKPTLAEKISIHLDECTKCGPAYERKVAAKQEVAHIQCCGGHHAQRAHGRTSIG